MLTSYSVRWVATMCVATVEIVYHLLSDVKVFAGIQGTLLAAD